MTLTMHPPRTTLSPYTTLFRSATGHIDWKLGGRHSSKSLRIIGDHYASKEFGGQHDVRMLNGELLRGVVIADDAKALGARSEEHTSELQSRFDLVCRLLLGKKK